MSFITKHPIFIEAFKPRELTYFQFIAIGAAGVAIYNIEPLPFAFVVGTAILVLGTVVSVACQKKVMEKTVDAVE